MHPAISVILLTTLLGVGQGLFLALYTDQLYSAVNLLPGQDSERFYALGSGLAMLFLLGGLGASFFHLGHPERAWRAITRWRTSWLSREVIVLPAVMFLVAVYGLTHYLGWTQPLFVAGGTVPIDATLLVGALATLATLLLFVCTAMIYASVKFLQEWHSPLTVVNYVLLGGASGFTLAAAFSAWLGTGAVGFYSVWAIILTLTALTSRGASLLRNRRLKYKSSLQTAIGVRHTRITQKAQGAMGGSYNTHEFFHGRGAPFLSSLRVAFLALAFAVPVLLLGAGYVLDSAALLACAFLVQYLGLMAERWYFFAEAQHPQNLYYQSVS